MKQRIIVAVIGIPALLAVLCFAPDWATAVLVALLCVIGCHEFMAAAAPLKARRWWPFAASLSVLPCSPCISTVTPLTVRPFSHSCPGCWRR